MAPVDKVRKTERLNENEKDGSDAKESSGRDKETGASFGRKSPIQRSPEGKNSSDMEDSSNRDKESATSFTGNCSRQRSSVEKDDTDLEDSSKRGTESGTSLTSNSPRQRRSEDASFLRLRNIEGKSYGLQSKTLQGSQGSQSSPGSSAKPEDTREHDRVVSFSIDGKPSDLKDDGANVDSEDEIPEEEDQILLTILRSALPRGSPTFEQVIQEQNLSGQGSSQKHQATIPPCTISTPPQASPRRVSWADEKGLSLATDDDL